MTKKTYKKIDSRGHEETWEWDETPEMTKAVARLHETIRQNKIKELNLKSPKYKSEK